MTTQRQLEIALNTDNPILTSLAKLLDHIPQDWLKLTTHRLDIYNEEAAKVDFLSELKILISSDQVSTVSLEKLPTAYDYIRLGHQLSSLLEWILAEINQVTEAQVISFASNTMPILAVLRTNKLNNKQTYIYYDGEHSPLLDETRLRQIYGYQYQIKKINQIDEIRPHSDGSVLFVTSQPFNEKVNTQNHVNITVNLHTELGSYVIIHDTQDAQMVNDIQHVRRRETIAMSPLNCLSALYELVGRKTKLATLKNQAVDTVNGCIKDNTGSQYSPLIASSGLSIQYAILMGLVEDAMVQHPNKPIKIILPPNCYGGTNDQSRRVADLIPQVSIVDLLVDGGADLVNSLENALNEVAAVDGVPIVLAEIPTNPRVEVPDMIALGDTLSKQRLNANDDTAIAPVFMVDQTFCPNVKLLHDHSELKAVKTISFSSGSKFPSGGRCIAGYCATNNMAVNIMPLIASHLALSDNAADNNQLNILAETMPSMPERIAQAYENTKQLVEQIKTLLPNAKMFYVTDLVAQRGFMPSVFSLDLPVNAATQTERQDLQKELNKKLIEFMINKHPKDCKNCVSYGQLKGSYWTIPATSTQGTTKEGDKDYVVRASVAPDVDVNLLAQSFEKFCKQHHLL